MRPPWGDTKSRHVLPGVPKHWLNVYLKIDLIGSNYRTDTEEKGEVVSVAGKVDSTAVTPTDNVPWEIGIEPKFTNLLEFYGFSSHGMYWGLDNENERNVFLTVVRRVYADSATLT